MLVMGSSWGQVEFDDHAILQADRPGERLERRELACDLYAGAGVTTVLLRERFAEVVACEAYPESAAALGVEPHRRRVLPGLARRRPRSPGVDRRQPAAGGPRRRRLHGYDTLP
jgi:hypothetical protein